MCRHALIMLCISMMHLIMQRGLAMAEVCSCQGHIQVAFYTVYLPGIVSGKVSTQ